MIYDSLLLPHGGILDDAARAPLDTRRAHMVIGIGGNGMDALRIFKGNLHRQFLPDDPQADIPHYRGISLLGIDADPESLENRQGLCRLTHQEFFHLSTPDPLMPFKNPALITVDPFLNWMDVEHARPMAASQNQSRIRQMGRFLLTRHAPALENRLLQNIMEALNSIGAHAIDIFVLAGLGGGTGSGCFLDVCYLLRHIAHVYGIQLTIHGYFFLPEVVISKAPMGIDPCTADHLQANGYAALKELDYLMDLKDRGDIFSHTYGPGLQVDTQDPPVDHCYLLGATPNGLLQPNGYQSACRTAAEHILFSVTDCSHPANAIPMASHQMDVANAVALQPQLSGCRQPYKAIGVSTVRIPREEMFTYLACGFFERFIQTAGPTVHPVDKKTVEDLARDLRLTTEDILRRLTADLPAFELPQIHKQDLRREGPPPINQLPHPWKAAGDRWLSSCQPEIEKAARVLTIYPNDYDLNRLLHDSLTHHIFRRLWKLCVDPAAGPWVAAGVLHSTECDLIRILSTQIDRCEHCRDLARFHLTDAERNLEEAKNHFHGTMLPSESRFQSYRASAITIYRSLLNIRLYDACADTLRKLRDQLQQLSVDFFDPLVRVLEDLRDTFEENRPCLRQLAPVGTDHPILDLVDIGTLCDPLIQGLTPQDLVCDFLDALLSNRSTWLRDDKTAFIRLIRRYMVDRFPTVTQMTLEDHLYRKFPQAQGSPTILQNLLASSIAVMSYREAMPPVRRAPQVPADHAVQLTVSDVPLLSMTVQSAYLDMQLNLPPGPLPLMRLTPGTYGIRTVNTYVGLPLYFQAVLPQLRQCYLHALKAEWGLHLYSATGRGFGEQKDWASLPDPFPGSCMPQLQPLMPKIADLYSRAEEISLIYRDVPTGKDVLVRLPPIPKELTETPSPEQERDPWFCREQILRLDDALTALRSAASLIYLPFRDPHPEQQRLLNMDHLALSPKLQQLLCDQLDSLDPIFCYRSRLERLLADMEQESRNRVPPPPPPIPPGTYEASVDESGAIHVMDPTDGALLVVYPDRDPHTAVDPSSGHSRPVCPEMLVFGNGNWFSAVHCRLLYP